jgi:hypothetical protein
LKYVRITPVKLRTVIASPTCKHICFVLCVTVGLALGCFTGLPSWASPNDKEGSSKGWLVFQESSNGGPINFVVTDQAIRIDIRSCGFSAIAKAPDWNICVFRADTKEMGFVKLSQWRNFNTNTVGATDECTLDKPISKKPIKLRAMDVPTYQYLFPGEKITTAIFQTEKQREITNYIVDSYQLAKAPQVAAIQCHLYNCTELDGLLINCMGKVKETNEMHWFIHTRKLIKSDTIPASTFALPKNYKTLKTIDSRFKFKGMTGSIDEFGEMLDIGKVRSAKPKQPKP